MGLQLHEYKVKLGPLIPTKHGNQIINTPTNTKIPFFNTPIIAKRSSLKERKERKKKNSLRCRPKNEAAKPPHNLTTKKPKKKKQNTLCLSLSLSGTLSTQCLGLS
jgi:hypothetical protein